VPVWEEALDADASRVSGASRVWVVKCAGCGFCFTNPRPSEEILSGYYGLVKDGSSAADEGSFSRRALFAQGLALIRRLAPGRRILDVGCWTGEFLDVARAEGFPGRGVEINPVLAEYARSHHGLDVVVGRFGDTPLEPGSAAAVTMWDVLEHLRDPRGAVRRAFDVLVPAGILIVVSPNVRFQLTKSRMLRCLGRPATISGIAHLNHFSERTLADLIAREGFTVVHRGVAAAHLRGGQLENVLRRSYVTMARLARTATGVNVNNSLLLVARKGA
jgi:SAM-dependent methyltransferase